MKDKLSLVTSISGVVLGTAFAVSTVIGHVPDNDKSFKDKPLPQVTLEAITDSYEDPVVNSNDIPPVRNRITQSLVDNLAALVYHEDREDAITRYVVDVVFMRVKLHWFPDNVYDVIHQPGAFSFWEDLKKEGIDPFAMPDTYERNKAYRVATNMLHDFYNGEWEPPEELQGAMYYINKEKVLRKKGKLPDWVNPSCEVKGIKNTHTFYNCHKNA